MSSSRRRREVIAWHGLIGFALRRPRLALLDHPSGTGKLDRDNPSRVQGALGRLDIVLIPAWSPEARGR
jgi:hypothetical protein